MIGLAHHNIAVVSVILDRKRYFSHTVIKSDPDWSSQLKQFLNKMDPTARQRIVLFDDVFFMKRLRAELESSPEGTSYTKSASNTIFVVFDTPENLSLVPDINIIDATLEGSSWRHHKIIPSKFNDLLSDSLPWISVLPPMEKVKNFSPQNSSPSVEEDNPDVPIFDPSKTLYFQFVEDCLSVIPDDQKRQTLRQLIAAWHSGSLSVDHAEKIHKRLQKNGVDVSLYISWTKQADKFGYIDSLRKASLDAANNPSRPLKDLSQSFNVRVGDLKWINQNWPFINLVSQASVGSSL